MAGKLLNKVGEEQGEKQIEQQDSAQNIYDRHHRSDFV
jgi:hypothetical protein